MLINLTIRQLQAFAAVAQSESYTKASGAIGVSQPALTAGVRHLEHVLGVRLLDRTTRVVQLTNEGRTFLAAVERILADLNAAVADAREIGERRRGRVEIACLPSVAVRLVGPLVIEARRRYPGVVVKVYDGDAQSVAHRVQIKEADFGIGSYWEGETELDFLPLVQDRFCVVCRRDHPLGRKRAVRFRELEPYPFIALGPHTGTRQIVDRAAAKADVKLDIVCELKQLSSLNGIVETGVGVSILPEACLPIQGQGDLVVRRLMGPTIARDIGLLLRRGRALSPSAQSLRDLVVENIGPRWKAFAAVDYCSRRGATRAALGSRAP